MTGIGARLRESASILDRGVDNRLERIDAAHRMLEAADLLDKQHYRIEKLADALKDCVDDLANFVETYYEGKLDYPSQKLKYDRDMQPVAHARNLLAEVKP